MNGAGSLRGMACKKFPSQTHLELGRSEFLQPPVNGRIRSEGAVFFKHGMSSEECSQQAPELGALAVRKNAQSDSHQRQVKEIELQVLTQQVAHAHILPGSVA